MVAQGLKKCAASTRCRSGRQELAPTEPCKRFAEIAKTTISPGSVSAYLGREKFPWKHKDEMAQSSVEINTRFAKGCLQ
jgi:hypothetical protein